MIRPKRVKAVSRNHRVDLDLGDSSRFRENRRFSNAGVFSGQLTCPRSMVRFTSLYFIPLERGGLCHQVSMPSTANSGGWFFSWLFKSHVSHTLKMVMVVSSNRFCVLWDLEKLMLYLVFERVFVTMSVVFCSIRM